MPDFIAEVAMSYELGRDRDAWVAHCAATGQRSDDLDAAIKWRDERKANQPATTRARSIVGDESRDHARGQALLRKVCDELAAMPDESGRNSILNQEGGSLFRYALSGRYFTEDEVRDALTDAMHRNSYVASDGMRAVDATLNSAHRYAQAKGPKYLGDRDEPGAIDHGAFEDVEKSNASGTGSDRILLDEEEAFWDARPELSHIRQFAHARFAAPWATLGATLARIVTAVDPTVRLPALRGGQGSLNTFVGIVGPSGSGKDAAVEVAANAIEIVGAHIETASPGSGEGIAHAYVQRSEGQVVQHTHRVLFVANEVTTLGALKERSASTLLPELCRAWSGQQLGFQYVDKTKRLPVPAHAYRLCLIVGVQPRHGGILLDEADGGTPQRFLWLPALDPSMPRTPPEAPEPLQWRPTARMTSGSVQEVGVCQTARDVIYALAYDRHTSKVDETLDGHLALCRLKVGAALGLLDGRLEVSEEDWHLAGVVMKRSAATRQSVVAELNKQHREANRARGHDEAERLTVVTSVTEEQAIKKLAAKLPAKLDTQTWLSGSKLRRKIASADRHLLDEAIARAVAAGTVVAEDVAYHGLPGAQYRAAA